MNVNLAIDRLREKADQANELHRLRDRVEELEELLGLVSRDGVDRFVLFRLSRTERKILNVIFSWNLVRREKLYALLYGSRPESDQPEIKVLDTYVCRLRIFLRQFDIVINTQRADGWFMAPLEKQKLAKVLDQINAGTLRQGHNR
jgi:hypothetical protein